MNTDRLPYYITIVSCTFSHMLTHTHTHTHTFSVDIVKWMIFHDIFFLMTNYNRRVQRKTNKAVFFSHWQYKY